MSWKGGLGQTMENSSQGSYCSDDKVRPAHGKSPPGCSEEARLRRETVKGLLQLPGQERMRF